jgi:AraC-like DNA-binding protein
LNKLANALRITYGDVRLSRMPVASAPGVAVWPAAMIVWGPGFTSTPHRHHCIQLVMTLHGSLRVRGADGTWRRCGAALVRPDVLHAVDAPADTVLLAFIEAESELGAGLCAQMARGIVCLSASRVARWRSALGSPLSNERIEQWMMTYLLPRRRPTRIDTRVQRVFAYVRQRLATRDDLSLAALAAAAGLSRSRFMHLFTESVGVPVRPYVRWLRLQRAACELIEGVSVSSAAHRAGFSDAAHLTRTFRRTLGMAPSELALRRRLARGLPPIAADGARRAAPVAPDRYRRAPLALAT